MIPLSISGLGLRESAFVLLFGQVGITPEAPTLEAAFGGNRPTQTIRYGKAERRRAYEAANVTAKSRDVDFIMLGCPHYTIEQIWEVCKLLQGRKLSPNTEMWIFTPRQTAHLAEQNGYTRILRNAGAHLMSDTCSSMGRLIPRGAKVAAVDSVKQVHYLPAIMGIE